MSSTQLGVTSWRATCSSEHLHTGGGGAHHGDLRGFPEGRICRAIQRLGRASHPTPSHFSVLYFLRVSQS